MSSLWRLQMADRRASPLSPESVWRTLSDTSSWGQWNPHQPVFCGSFRAGERVWVSVKLGPLSSLAPAKVVVCEPPHRIEWQGGLPGLLLVRHGFTLQAAEGGGCQLEHHESFAGLLVPLIAWLLRPLLGRVYGETSQALLEAASRGELPAPPAPLGGAG